MKNLITTPTVELGKEYTKLDLEIDMLEQKLLLLMQKRYLVRTELIKRITTLEQVDEFKPRNISIQEESLTKGEYNIKL